MTSFRKDCRAMAFAMLAFFSMLSGAKAVNISVQVDWNNGFTANSSTGATLSTPGVTLQLGWFNSVPTNWVGVNRSNLSGSFTSIAQLSYAGAGTYLFNGNYTALDTTYVYDSDGVTVKSEIDNSLAVNRAFLVMTSGSDQLGIFSWALPDGTQYNLPRDPDRAPADVTAVDTTVGGSDSYIYNMTAQVGRVTTAGLQLASASGAVTSGAVTSPQSITFGAIPSKSVGDSFTLAATATSGLPVTYTSSNPAVATVAGSIVTIVGSGSVVITASQVGNSSYSAATDVGQTITSYPTTALRLASLGTPVLSGGQTSVTHTFVGNPNATYTIEYKNDLSAATWTSITAQTGANGTFTATFTSSGDYVNAWKNRMFFRAKNS
jgi:hypothetical protein